MQFLYSVLVVSHNLLSLMIFAGVSRAFFRLPIAFVNFLLGPSGSFNAAMSASVSNMRASKSICSASRVD